MKIRTILAAGIVALLPSAPSAQTANDLVQSWLAAHSKIPATGDYATCDPAPAPVVGTDGICAWSAGKLGSQPTTQQLQTLAPAWQAQQKAAQADSRISGGIKITSSGTPALSATYACDATWQAYINAEVVSLLLNGAFSNGQATKDWPDIVGGSHVFDATHFKDFATKTAAYVDAMLATKRILLAGTPTDWPVSIYTIQ